MADAIREKLAAVHGVRVHDAKKTWKGGVDRGTADPWEPIAEARRWANSHSCIEELHELPGVGHCPHDEAPEQVNPVLQRWLAA